MFSKRFERKKALQKRYINALIIVEGSATTSRPQMSRLEWLSNQRHRDRESDAYTFDQRGTHFNSL